MNDRNEWLLISVVLIPLVGILCSVVYWTIYNKISPMPTLGKVKREFLQALPKDINGKIYELGCGWGTLLLPLAQTYPLHPVIGFETSHLPFLISRLRVWQKGSKNVDVKRQDFFSVKIEGAALVVCYLYPAAMLRLKTKFAQELAAGTWVISHTFAIPGWQPVATYQVNDLYRTKIYVYRV